MAEKIIIYATEAHGSTQKKIEPMHPILFYIADNFYIGTYGALVAFGALVGALLALHRARRAGIPTDFIIDLLFYSTVVGFIGARLFFIFVNFKDFLLHPAHYIFSRQGFVFLGGIVFALPVAIYYTRKKKMPAGKVADVLAPSLPLAHIFGRLGCFAAGCCYGKICLSPHTLLCKIALSFPAVYDRKGELIGSFVYIDHLQRGLVQPTDLHSLPVIPTQLLEAGANFLIVLSLLGLSKLKLRSGTLFLFYLLFYSVARFAIEFLRGDSERGFLFNIISTSQLISLIIILAVAIYIIHTNRSKKSRIHSK